MGVGSMRIRLAPHEHSIKKNVAQPPLGPISTTLYQPKGMEDGPIDRVTVQRVNRAFIYRIQRLIRKPLP